MLPNDRPPLAHIGALLALAGAVSCARWSEATVPPPAQAPSGPEQNAPVHSGPGQAKDAAELADADNGAPFGPPALAEEGLESNANEQLAQSTDTGSPAQLDLPVTPAPASSPRPVEAEADSNAQVYAPTAESGKVRELPPAAVEPSPDERADESPVDPEPAPRFKRGAELLGLEVQLADGTRVGTLDDAVIDPLGGEVLAFTVLADTQVLLFDRGALRWDVPGFARALLTPSSLDSFDVPGLFASEESARIAGKIEKIEALTGARGSSTIVLVRDAKNLLHRILLSGGRLVLHRYPALSVGAEATFDGVLTRDDLGKLWIARSVVVGGNAFELRDGSGAVLWSELAEGYPTARQLMDLTAEVEGGGVLEVADWVFDIEESRAAYLSLEIDSPARLVPWSDLTPSDGDRGAWSVSAPPLDMSALSTLSPGGQVRAADPAP